MEIIHLDKRKTLKSPVAVALGYFDGLHTGHQAVISNAVDYAKKNHIKSAVMTFSTNPKRFLNKSLATNLLTPLTEKTELLEQLGVDLLLILPFNDEIAKMKPDEFIKEFLIEQGARYVTTGFDFRFGRNGAGNSYLLKNYEQIFGLNIVPKMELNALKIGTTQIREYLSQGDVNKAHHMLGRPYSLTGIVVKGRQKGREIGFPTANIKINEEYVIPKEGVYAVKVYIDEGEYMGMCNIGHNPTFNYTANLSIEVNILDFNADIYGKTIKLEFFERLRGEQAFNSLEELLEQLTKDRKKTSQILK